MKLATVDTADEDYGRSLAPGARVMAEYAAGNGQGRGRRFAEPDCPMRSPYQRDRDRILHCTAFRRLTYKTQVFLVHEGDHFRTRLTHSLEVAQIARAMARLLKLDEDLAEALALAHDLGHPPFGHAGERALDEAMRPWGGFDHNAQSLRIVTELERKYAAWDGLNLAWDTLEGLVKHNGPILADTSDPTGMIRSYDAVHDLQLRSYPSAEAQIAALADDIAYNNHDIDDGLRAGLIATGDLRGVSLPGRLLREVETSLGAIDGQRLLYEVNRRMITIMLQDVVEETRRRLTVLAPRTAADIRAAERPVAAFSKPLLRELDELRAFLLTSVYRHPRVVRVMDGAESIVRDLTRHYMAKPEDLPEPWQDSARVAAGGRGSRTLPRLICDFVAGMTDRYAIQEHRRLFDATPELR
jgi:dGTPase